MREVSSGDRNGSVPTMRNWRAVVQRAYQTMAEIQSKLDAGESLSGEERRLFHAAQSLTRKYSISGKRRQRTHLLD